MNGVASKSFEIGNGTRQGCSLSKLLFILSLEPLLQHIWNNPDISGLQTSTYHHKVAAYADDFLFYLSNPLVSLPVLLFEIRTYGELSDFTVNLQKSEALSVNLPPQSISNLSGSLPFRWAPRAIQYLGTRIPSNLQLIFQYNFQTLLAPFSADLEKRKSLAVSWFGRCNVIKMNVMQRLLYLLQSLPIKLPQEFFRKIRAAFIRYVWQGKHSHLKRALLQRSKLRGGVELPDPALYCLAVHMTKVVDWYRHTSHKLWVSLEQESVTTPLAVLPWTRVHHS